ncbi:MAG: hydroxyacid dehydrogenase [Marinifilaceae bacterium]|jgi:D-3-phosphoglycerate dehydrogenase|nr:hydroxyacid dehydrogenase [Marinifilaceae bacterium]
MNIVLLEPLGMKECQIKKVKEEFESQDHKFTYYTNRTEDQDSLIERSKDAEVIIVSNIKLSSEFINKCPKLKFISVAFTGVDHIDIDACNKNGIKISNASGYATEAVAELSIGMMISGARTMIGADSITRFGGDRGNNLGWELKNKTLGIIGTGEIGLRVAEIAKVLGCNIIAYSRTKKNNSLNYVDFDYLIKNSDIISLHVPLTDETKNMIGEQEFKSMKNSCYLINTARAAVVDYKALEYALDESEIAGAAIDIYEKEPPLDKDYNLFKAPNLTMLPHIGYATYEAFEQRWEIVIKNILCWLENKQQNIIL